MAASHDVSDSLASWANEVMDADADSRQQQLGMIRSSSMRLIFIRRLDICRLLQLGKVDLSGSGQVEERSLQLLELGKEEYERAPLPFVFRWDIEIECRRNIWRNLAVETGAMLLAWI